MITKITLKPFICIVLLFLLLNCEHDTGPDTTVVASGGDDSDNNTDSGNTNDQGLHTDTELEETVTFLYSAKTILEPAVQEQTETALHTFLADRARDRHAREDQYMIYDHYLPFYWEHRTAAIEIIDTVPFGGSEITFNVTTQWRLDPVTAELRFFYLGRNTVAEYYNNGVMTRLSDLNYTRSVNFNSKTGQPLTVGDRMEFELSQFLQGVPRGRNAYYGTTFLYIVGEGIMPWFTKGSIEDPTSEREDSYPIAAKALLGGDTTLPYQYSGEPDHHFQQMATNLAPTNGQKFVLGRRIHHTDFEDGSHDESNQNPLFNDLRDKLGNLYLNNSCIGCHQLNGRGVAPNVDNLLDQYLFLVASADGTPHPLYGNVLHYDARQPVQPEGSVVIASWTETDGLRSPNYQFSPETPDLFSARIPPQLVGLGLLEAIAETAIIALADPNDANEDGISGRVHYVENPTANNATQVGRFGWKASKASLRQQVVETLNTDMGVISKHAPTLDCGSSQSSSDCANNNALLSETHIDNLVAYIALLGIRPQRDYDSAQVVAGEQIFKDLSCNACHVEQFTTSEFHPHAELRNQVIKPYTDLLLHDMGAGLADSLGEGNANGAEWRTAPLWNIGLTAQVSGEQGYLHDGRARTLKEAILWHGGEALTSRQQFEQLSATEQDNLIAFLQSL